MYIRTYIYTITFKKYITGLNQSFTRYSGLRDTISEPNCTFSGPAGEVLRRRVFSTSTKKKSNKNILFIYIDDIWAVLTTISKHFGFVKEYDADVNENVIVWRNSALN